MVERVARALVEDWHKHNPASMKAWDEQPDFGQDNARRAARAAIEAMREPTEAMMVPSRLILDTWDDDMFRVWNAMIDAALWQCYTLYK